MNSTRPPGTLDTGGGEDVGCAACGAWMPPGGPCPGCGTESHDPRPGTLVAGRYRVEELLGAGGMGRVYRATHVALGESVAVKFLLAETSTRGELRARFRREAQVLARLRHPGVVTVLDYGEHADEPYLVMELLHGRTLESVVQSDAPLAAGRAAALLDPVLEVLASAHAAGIVHRDLKPENVMLVPSGMDAGVGAGVGTGPGERVKVLDFGIAALTDAPGDERLTTTGAVRGTPHYMSPEQCVGRGVGPATDIYAAGAVLYELLTGSVPFPEGSAAEMMAHHLFMAPPTVASRRTGSPVPAGLEALVQRALAKRPAERPTAAEFRVALAAAVAGTDTAGRAATEGTARAGSAGLSRTERALAPAGRQPVEPDPVAPGMTSPRVALWGFSAVRSHALQAALAVHGVTAVPWLGEELPPPLADNRPWRALLVCAGPQAEGRTHALKADELHGRTPVLVLDASSPADAPVLVRAGASDVALDRVDDTAICQKVLRAVRRGR